MKNEITSCGFTAKFLRKEEYYAVLINEQMGEFRWPAACLPPDIAPGENIEISVKKAGQEKNEQYERMRQLLEELIN